MGVWKIWFSILNFHSFSKRTRGGGHGQGPQKKGDGRVRASRKFTFGFSISWCRGCGSEPWARGPPGGEEAGLENLVFNSKFPRFG